MMAEEHNSFRYRLFQKNGYLLTANGSDDGKVQPEDLKDYQVLPPAIIDLSSTNPETIPVESASSESAHNEIDEAIKFDEEENMILVGTEIEDTTQNKDGEDGWVFNYLADLDMY